MGSEQRLLLRLVGGPADGEPVPIQAFEDIAWEVSHPREVLGSGDDPHAEVAVKTTLYRQRTFRVSNTSPLLTAMVEHSITDAEAMGIVWNRLLDSSNIVLMTSDDAGLESVPE